MFNTNLMLNNSFVPYCLCACFPLLKHSYHSPNCGATRCCLTCSGEVSWFLRFHKSLQKTLAKAFHPWHKQKQVSQDPSREMIQRFSLAGIHCRGRDLRVVWEEAASLAEFGSPARGRWGIDPSSSSAVAAHPWAWLRRKSVGGNTCSPLGALAQAKPHGAVSGFAMHLVDAVYSQILLLSRLDLIWEGLKESTLGRIVWGEDT